MMDTMEHDYSDVTRLDQHFAVKRRQELNLEAETQKAQHAVTMGGLRNERIRKIGLASLAGGAGLGLALFGASFLIAPMPKINYREIDVPKVTMRDVTVPNIVSKDVPVDHVVPQEVPVDHVVPHDVPVDHIVPHDVPMPGPASTSEPPVASAPPMEPDSPYAAKTPDEQKFVEKPAYKDARYHGRIIRSVDGKALSFEDGKSFWPYRWDETTEKVTPVEDSAFDSDQFVGELGMCVKDEHGLSSCVALHNGREVNIVWKSVDSPPASAPTAETAPPSKTTEPCHEVSANGLPILVPRCAPKPGLSGLL